MRRVALALLTGLLVASSAFAQANGTLQIHYLNVGQGDGAVLISPQGEIVLFDDGVVNQCSGPIAYLASIGVTHIDYHIASHYHSDHIGCAPQVLQTFPLIKAAYDRGGSYGTTTFTSYVNAVGTKRITAAKGQSIILDAASANPVTITFVALNGNGFPTTDENDLSLVSVVHFGAFDAEFGGDLSGATTGTADTDPNVPVTTPTQPPGCSYSVLPTAISAGSGGGNATVTVTTTTGCAWAASSNASWIVLTSGASGNGSGTAFFSVAANTGSARSGSITVAGQSVSVSQAGVATTPVCCKVCTTGQPCGDTCISLSYTCHTAPGCACDVISAFAAGVSATPQFLNYTPIQGPIAYSYMDIESGVGGLVGQIEVYKVHHHASTSSSNTTWLAATTPRIGIISVGPNNTYGHPTLDALSRLHNANVKTYWTTSGNGAAPTAGQDFVSIGSAIVVQAAPQSGAFTVTYNGVTDTYNDWGPAAGAPFGSFDTPATGVSINGEVAVTGWALDDSGVTGVDIYRAAMLGEPTQANGLVFIGNATLVNGARPDVAGLYPTYPGASSAGWGYMLMSNMLPNGGNGTFTVYAYARTADGANVALGSKTIVAGNSTATKPFGTIDTPGQGQAVSGSVVNFGWALTPQPSNIPVDGSTINVYIDGVFVGHPDYGHPRADIQALFPGYANTNTAVGAFVIDTTKLQNGVHSISWSVTDNAGNTSGIGSRFFTVANP
jgi:beta-lactamase superfamily II metal-dependent hydrolase